MIGRIKRLFALLWYMTGHAGLLPDIHWNEDDDAELKRFFGTPAGAKLRIALEHGIHNNNDWATNQTQNTAHACGFAAGWKACAKYILFTSRATADSGESGDAPNSDKPKDKGDEAANDLETRYSP